MRLLNLSLAALIVFVTTILACPNPNLRHEQGLPPYSPRHTVTIDELDADSTHSFDVTHYDITLEPDQANYLFDAEVVITATAMQNDLNEVIIHLAECMVNSVNVNGQDVTYSYVGDEISISLPAVLMTGDEFDITVNYQGPLRTDWVFGGIMYANWRSTIWTHGEPYETRYWLASYDEPFDKATSEMTVVTSDSLEVVSNGELVSEELIGNGYKRTIWNNPYQTSTYLISVAIGPYQEIDMGTAGVNDVPITCWTYEDMIEDTEFDMGRTGEMLVYFEELFGPYIFNKYDQALAQIFNGWGAMEHQTSTTYGYLLVNGERTYEHIVAHELGHQWFGDMVGPLTFSEMWLNEGFATYTDMLWAEYLGEDQLQNRIANLYGGYMTEDQTRHRYPIWDPPDDYLFGAAVYNKGAFVLHMLRFVIGDEAFFAAVQNYVEDHLYGSAITPELQATFEEDSGEDLGWFFDEWVYDQGYPEYLFTNFAVHEENSHWIAELDIAQNQDNAPLFSMPLPFKVYNQAGDEADVRVEVQPLEFQTVTLPPLGFQPTNIEFNPENIVLCLYHTDLSVDQPVEYYPTDFEVSLPWPNPFNSHTGIKVELPYGQRVNVSVYNLLGREVASINNSYLSRGQYQFQWSPETSMASGQYFMLVDIGERQETRRLMLLK